MGKVEEKLRKWCDKQMLIGMLEKEEKEYQKAMAAKETRCPSTINTAAFGFADKEYRCQKEPGHEGHHLWKSTYLGRNLEVTWGTREVD